MKVTRVHPFFVAELSELDLNKPIGSEDAARVRDALVKNKVLIVRGQRISERNYIDFCSALGSIWTTHDEMRLESRFQYENFPELVRVSNIHGVLGKIELLYHADGSHHPTRPYPIRALYAQSIPNGCGGNTTWADMEIAYDRLPPEMKAELASLQALHVPRYSTGWEDQAVYHPLIRVHPVSGRKSLSVDQYFTRTIAGWDETRAHPFLNQLLTEAVRHDNLYTHVWQEGDLVIFDNNNTVHRRDPILGTDERLLLRVTMDFQGSL